MAVMRGEGITIKHIELIIFKFFSFFKQKVQVKKRFKKSPVKEKGQNIRDTWDMQWKSNQKI